MAKVYMVDDAAGDELFHVGSDEVDLTEYGNNVYHRWLISVCLGNGDVIPYSFDTEALRDLGATELARVHGWGECDAADDEDFTDEAEVIRPHGGRWESVAGCTVIRHVRYMTD